MTQSQSCMVCGDSRSHVLYRSTVTPDMLASSINYIPTYNHSLLHGELSVCEECGFIFISDQPPPETYQQVYANMEDAKYLQEADGYRSSFRVPLEQLSKVHVPGKDLLEVGCGAGIFLQDARKEGWNVHGIELSKWMARQAESSLGAGVVAQGSYGISHPAKNKFDVIVALHVLEHVPDPVDFLKAMHPRLKDEGVLYLVTPDIGSLIAKVLGEKWWYIQIPHIYYFNRQTVRRLLEKHGYTIENITTYPRFVTNKLVENRIDFLPSFLRPIARIVFWPFLLFPWSFRFDTGDQMTILARRKS